MHKMMVDLIFNLLYIYLLHIRTVDYLMFHLTNILTMHKWLNFKNLIIITNCKKNFLNIHYKDLFTLMYSLIDIL